MLLVVDGSAEAIADFRRRVGRRPGLRLRAGAGPLIVEAAAGRIEALGPAIEAAGLASGTTICLRAADAVIESGSLEGRPSGVWAAIGDAADRRTVDRDRGDQPTVDLLHFVRLEESGDRRVAVDGRAPRVDRPVSAPPDLFPTKFDDADWHADGAAGAGQPPEHASAHIAFYLTWLIRRDLVDRRRLGRAAERVRAGGVVDEGLMSDVDGKLVSDLMTDRGAAFSEASYDAYLMAYERVFGDEPDYSVAPDAATYARIEPELDALWSSWAAGSRDHH